MATIVNRGSFQWQATVRRKGFPSQTRTFESKRDAQDWAATLESEMRRGLFIDRTEVERTTLGELLCRYSQDVTPTKRGKTPELSRLRHLMRHPIAMKYLAQLRAADFAEYRDQRLGAAFRRACKRAGITDLHYHDLRHEAASRFAPRMQVPLLAKLMGWRTIQMAMRYYNPTETELVALVRTLA